jgi:ketosteroid isomerase-like protein
MATPKELFFRQLECLENDDREAQLALYSDDCVYEFPFANDRPQRILGQAEIRRVMTPMWSEARAHGAKVAREAVSVLETSDPEQIVVEFTLRCEVKGATFRLRFVQFMRARGDLITEMREYFNPHARSELLR